MHHLTADHPRDRTEPAVPDRPPETIRIEPTKGFSRVLSPRELWRYRDLAFQIAARDVTVRYRQTALGAAWAVLQPISLMLVFTLFFGRLAGIESNGIPYWLFALAGLVPWIYFSSALLLGSESLVINHDLVSKIYFPRIFMPLGVVIAGLIDIAISILILLAATLISGTVPGLPILVLPLLVLTTAATALGASAFLSAVNVRYRDVRYVVPFAVQMWMFLTPIVYPSSLLSSTWQTISAINPMVGVVEGFRWAVLDTGSAPLDQMAVSAGAALVLLALGLAYFDRVERSFADLI
jgi:lipopolysaccharide transport system permease protein